MTINLRARYIERPRISILPIEGYGKNVTGGLNSGRVYTVTSNSGTSSGSFAYFCNSNYGGSNSDCIVRFAPNITWFDTGGALRYVGNNVTIDGFTDHPNGILYNPGATAVVGNKAGIGVYRGRSNVHIKGINFFGWGWHHNYYLAEYPFTQMLSVAPDNFAIDCDVAGVSDILIERCTFDSACDGNLDLNGGGYSISNVTIQQCLFLNCAKCFLVKYGYRHHISIHHNLFVHNAERHPEVRGNADHIDIVNNVIFQNISNPAYVTNYKETYDINDGWDPNPALRQPEPNTGHQGIRIFADLGAGVGVGYGNPQVNLRGNCFIGDGTALELCKTINGTETYSGIYWDPEGLGANNNHWEGMTTPVSTRDAYNPPSESWVGPATAWVSGSPALNPNAVDAGFEITRHPITQLKDYFPQIGTPLRYNSWYSDQAERVATALQYMP